MFQKIRSGRPDRSFDAGHDYDIVEFFHLTITTTQGLFHVRGLGHSFLRSIEWSLVLLSSPLPWDELSVLPTPTSRAKQTWHVRIVIANKADRPGGEVTIAVEEEREERRQAFRRGRWACHSVRVQSEYQKDGQHAVNLEKPVLKNVRRSPRHESERDMTYLKIDRHQTCIE